MSSYKELNFTQLTEFRCLGKIIFYIWQYSFLQEICCPHEQVYRAILTPSFLNDFMDYAYKLYIVPKQIWAKSLKKKNIEKKIYIDSCIVLSSYGQKCCTCSLIFSRVLIKNRESNSVRKTNFFCLVCNT